MNIQEIQERQLAKDPRVYNAICILKQTDKSFTEGNFLGLSKKYSQSEVREIYFNAIMFGMQEGLKMGSISGQRIDLNNSCKTEKQKEFLDKFYKLTEEYNCAISYNPIEGMKIIDLKS